VKRLLRGLLLKPTLNLLNWLLKRERGNSLIIGGPLGWNWQATLDAGHHGSLAGPANAHRHSDLAVIGADDHHARDHATRHHSGGADALALGSLAGNLTDIQHGMRGAGLHTDSHARLHALDSTSNHTGRITLAQMARGAVPGQVLTAQGEGSDPVYAALPAGGTVDYQVFTESGIWTKPAGCQIVMAFCIGAGNGGQNGIYYGAKGGIGGGMTWRILPAAMLPETVPVVVGAGGASGGGTGGISSFGEFVKAGRGIGQQPIIVDVHSTTQTVAMKVIGFGQAHGRYGHTSSSSNFSDTEGGWAEYGGGGGGAAYYQSQLNEYRNGLPGGRSVYGGGGGGGGCGTNGTSGGEGGATGYDAFFYGSSGTPPGQDGADGVNGFCGQGGGGGGTGQNGGNGGNPAGGGGGGGYGGGIGGMGGRGEVRVFSW
jgi:hypothetical protein